MSLVKDYDECKNLKTNKDNVPTSKIKFCSSKTNKESAKLILVFVIQILKLFVQHRPLIKLTVGHKVCNTFVLT